MNVNKQTVVIVGQLKVIIKMPEKNPSKREIFCSENVNKWQWAGLSKHLVALLQAKSDRSEIWSEKKTAEHFDRIVLSGEKEQQIFAQIDLICEKEHC